MSSIPQQFSVPSYVTDRLNIVESTDLDIEDFVIADMMKVILDKVCRDPGDDRLLWELLMLYKNVNVLRL